jgi:hypothetical protein
VESFFWVEEMMGMTDKKSFQEMVWDEIAVRLFVRACGEFVMVSFCLSDRHSVLENELSEASSKRAFIVFLRTSFQKLLLNELSSCS